MTFDEWWNNWNVKDWNDIESAKNLFQQAFEAGLHADVHTDNSKVIQNFEAQMEKMKADVELARDNANETEDWGTFGVLNLILDNWEMNKNDRR